MTMLVYKQLIAVTALLLSQCYLIQAINQAGSQSISVLIPPRCPQGSPTVTICSFIPSTNNQRCCGTDPPLDDLESLCPIMSTTLSSTPSARRSCRTSFLAYWCTRSCYRTTASICSQAFQSTVTACSSACPDMIGILLPSTATNFLGTSASTSTTCSAYTYNPSSDSASPVISSFTSNYMLYPSANQAQFTYSISIKTTNIPEAILQVSKTEGTTTTVILPNTTIPFNSWTYVPATSIYTTTYTVEVDSSSIPYGILSVSATLNVYNSIGSATNTISKQLHTMTPTLTPTRPRTHTLTVTSVPFQCPDPTTIPGNTIIPVYFYNSQSCTGSSVYTLNVPLNYGSSWCDCFTAMNTVYSAINFKCDTKNNALTFSFFVNNYLCSIQSIQSYSPVSIPAGSCSQASFLSSSLYAKIGNFTPCAGWTRAATLPIQVSAADFSQALISTIGYGSMVDLTTLSTSALQAVVNNILSEGTQVMTSDARIEAIVDCRYLPLDSSGNYIVMQRTPSTPSSRVRSLGSTCSAAVVVAVDPAKVTAQLNLTLPAFPNMPNYTLTWMTDVISFTRLSAQGNVIHNDFVVFDVSCSSPLFLHFCQFDSSSNLCNLVSTPIVQNGKGWCTVTSPSTSSFIGFQALPIVMEQNHGRARTTVLTSTLATVVYTLFLPFLIMLATTVAWL